jgi:excisionase family DNA binding protein
MNAEAQSNVPLLHKVPQACKRISVGKTKLYQLIASGEIKPIHIDGITLIPETELQAVVQRRLADAP